MEIKRLLSGTALLSGSLLLTYVSITEAADTVFLKNGLSFQGEIVEEKRDEILFDNGLKKIHLLRSEIKKLNKDEASRARYAAMLKALKPGDAAAHFELYKWCKAERLYSLSDQALTATLTADPNHAQAHRILGHEQRNGKWMTADEAKVYDINNPVITYNEESYADQNSPVLIKTTQAAASEQIEYNKSVLKLAKTLGSEYASDEEREEAVLKIVRDREKSGEVLLGCLNFNKVGDPETRVGALKGLQVARYESKRVAPSLAWSAVMDPELKVRDEAVDLIKTRKDDAAMAGMVRHLIGCYSENGEEVHGEIASAAVRSLRALGDRRVYDALLFYVTMELRPTVTELAAFNTRQIDSFTVNQGANATLIIPLSFPIQFPELKITKVRTTVCAPASALRALAGMDFGDDVGAWKRWIDQKHR